MNRRVFLKAVSASAVTGTAVLAGCSSGNNTNGGNGSANNASGGNGSASGGGGQNHGTTAGGAGESGQHTTQASAASTTPTASGTSAPTASTPPTTAGNASATGTQTETTTSGGSAGGTTTVEMYTKGGNYYFDPIGLAVEKGDTVTWKIGVGAHSSTAYEKGNGPATVTRIPDGAKAWDSGIMSEGQTFDHTFDTEGTYDYFCIPHKTLGMVGRIVVGSPGGPAEGSMPPDGKVPKSKAIVKQGSIPYSDFS